MTTSPDPSTIMVFDGINETTAYAFLAIRRAVKFRVDTGGSIMRGELAAARNHGWSEARTAKKVLEDMNAIAVDCGMPAI